MRKPKYEDRPRYRVLFINLRDEIVTETFSCPISAVKRWFEVIEYVPLNITATLLHGGQYPAAVKE